MNIKAQHLKQRQGLPLEVKIQLSRRRIREFYDYFDGDVYVSFSGGKDSTVLLDLVRSIYPHVPAVFVDTGLEAPEIKEFIRNIDNVVWLKPKMNFKEVLEVYGFPVVSKMTSMKIRELQTRPKDGFTYHLRSTGWTRKGVEADGATYRYERKVPKKWMYLKDAPFKVSEKCCDIMKKNPFKDYEKEVGLKPFIGTMASDSRLREVDYLRYGCNAFDGKREKSRPLGFWREENVWEYIKTRNIPYSKIYDMGWKRTGCLFCMFGVHLEKEPNRFQRMTKTHPQLHDYCINKLGCGKVLDYIGVNY